MRRVAPRGRSGLGARRHDLIGRLGGGHSGAGRNDGGGVNRPSPHSVPTPSPLRPDPVPTPSRPRPHSVPTPSPCGKGTIADLRGSERRIAPRRRRAAHRRWPGGPGGVTGETEETDRFRRRSRMRSPVAMPIPRTAPLSVPAWRWRLEGRMVPGAIRLPIRDDPRSGSSAPPHPWPTGAGSDRPLLRPPSAERAAPAARTGSRRSRREPPPLRRDPCTRARHSARPRVRCPAAGVVHDGAPLPSAERHAGRPRRERSGSSPSFRESSP